MNTAADHSEAQARAARNLMMEALAASHRENAELRALVHLPREPRISIGRAVVTDTIVYRVLRAGGSLADVIVALVEDRKRLVDEVVTLSTIAPRRFIATDGTEYIYRCPDDLVPDIEPAKQEASS